MNEENFKAWIREMRTTDKGQARETLCGLVSDESREIGYCCLGLGSLMVPEIAVSYFAFDPDAERQVQVGDALGEFGEYGVDGKAPREFIDWLGVENIQEVSPISGDPIHQWDLLPDYPEDLMTQGKMSRTADGLLSHTIRTFEDACKASDLNDGGFTFAQIADVFEFFGIRGAVL